MGMTIKVKSWTEDEAKKELARRLKRAKAYREKYLEDTWRENEITVFQAYEKNGGLSDVGISDVQEGLVDGFDSLDSDMGINYAFKYHRFIHAQMSANPPSVIPIPTSSEYKDRRAAKAADAFIAHGRRKMQLQEKVDLTTLQTLTYGSGFAKTCYDPYLGDAWDYDEETGEITMQGDISIKPRLIWNIFLDNEATTWDEVKYVFERHFMSYDEAVAKFGTTEEIRRKLKEAKGNGKKRNSWYDEDDKELVEDVVIIYEYYEKASPINGMDGRHCFLLEDGCLLTPVKPNKTPNAALPYHVLTDIDVPGHVYGKANIEYVVRLQDVLNKLDSTILDNVQAHSAVRLVVFEASEVPDDGITNNGWEVLNLRGGNGTAPHFMQPPQLMPDLYNLRQSIVNGMEQLMGTNESMFGQVSREMSGFSLQTAINAGNMVRRRLFNKYTLFVESMYSMYLQLVQEHYDDKRQILVVGEEGAADIAYFSGANISGGFDLKVDYGTSFSLDPASRREEIMLMWDKLIEGGATPRQLIQKLNLNEVGNLFDMMEVGKRRQLEIFDEMISKFEETGTLIYIEPEKNEDHGSMLEAAKEFRMGMVFKSLDPELQAAIDQHIDDRLEMAASVAAGGPGQEQAPPMPGMPPAPGAPMPGAEPAAPAPAMPGLPLG